MSDAASNNPDLDLEFSRVSSSDHHSISSLQAINDKSLDDIEHINPSIIEHRDPQQQQQTDEVLETSVITEYIHACQQGHISTVKELIESLQVSVKDLDHDGVSGLHWAAINNRLSVVKYLVSKGAEVDLRGGELKATPLQWACRYGLVYIADFLIRECKSNPELLDNQGFNCLHLAVHSSNIMLVIYLLNFTDIPINSTDPSGRTALHWAAYQGDSLTVDACLKYGANVTAKDATQFTALHWSLIRGVHEVIRNLIEHGCDVYEQINDGKDCFEIAEEMNCTSKLYSALQENGYRKDGAPIRSLMVPKTAKIVTFFQPYIALFVACKLLTFSQDFLIPKLITVLIYLILNHVILMKVVIPCYVHSKNPLMKTPYLAGIFSGTCFWVILIWLTKILPLSFRSHWFLNILFGASAAAAVSSFLKAMFINPGYIPRPAKRENIQNTIVDLIQLRKFDSKNFCIYTFIRKPLRSKFSWYSKTNVARFDHYCPWIFNEVGVRNHKLFLTFILSLELAIIMFLILANSYFSKLTNFDLQHENQCSLLTESFCKGYQQEPFLFNLTVWTCFQFMWLTFLIFVQLFQIFQGMTSYEAANVHRLGRDPNGNTRNPFYSSVPQESGLDDSNLSLFEEGSVQGQQQQQQQQQPHLHSEPKLGCIRSCLTQSSISKLLGLDLFVMTAKDAVKMKNSISSTNYGVKRNLLDFWFIRDDTIGEGYTFKTLMRLPIEGEGNLNGKLVDYYKLWELPLKGNSMV